MERVTVFVCESVITYYAKGWQTDVIQRKMRMRIRNFLWNEK